MSSFSFPSVQLARVLRFRVPGGLLLGAASLLALASGACSDSGDAAGGAASSSAGSSFVRSTAQPQVTETRAEFFLDTLEYPTRPHVTSGTHFACGDAACLGTWYAPQNVASNWAATVTELSVQTPRMPLDVSLQDLVPFGDAWVGLSYAEEPPSLR